MEATLKGLLPHLGLDGAEMLVLPHQGVQDLEQSIRRKLPNWHTPDDRFLVLRDNDGGDCVARKKKIQDLVDLAGKKDATKIRIVCQELEAWFLGDPVALESAGYLKVGSRPKSVRGNPDELARPSRRLDALSSKTRGKVSRAKDISPHLGLERNASNSFRVTIQAIKELTVD